MRGDRTAAGACLPSRHPRVLLVARRAVVVLDRTGMPSCPGAANETSPPRSSFPEGSILAPPPGGFAGEKSGPSCRRVRSGEDDVNEDPGVRCCGVSAGLGGWAAHVERGARAPGVGGGGVDGREGCSGGHRQTGHEGKSHAGGRVSNSDAVASAALLAGKTPEKQPGNVREG